MPKKPKVQRKKLIEKTFDDFLDSESSYKFLKLPGKNTADIENHDFSQPIAEMQQDDFLIHNYTPVTADPVISMLTDVSNEIVVSNSAKRKRISNNYICKKIKITDTVIEETPASSLASGAKTFYCSLNLYEAVNIDNPDIMQSIVPSFALARGASYSQPKISQCPTSVATNDNDKTLSGLDLSVAAKNNHGQPDIIEHFFSQKQEAFAVDNFMEDLGYNDNSMQNQGYVMSQLYNSQKQESSQHNTTPFNQVSNQEYVMNQLYNSQKQESSQDNTPSFNQVSNQEYVMNQLYNSQKQESSQHNTPPFNQVSNQEYVMTQLYDSHSFIPQNQQSLSSASHQNTAANSNIVNNFYTPQHCANGGFLLRNIGDQEKPLESDESDHRSVSSSNGKHQNLGVGQASPAQSNTDDARDIGENESFDTVVQTYHSDDVFAEDSAQSAGRSWQRKAFYKKDNLSRMNCSPAFDVHLPLINSPPIEYLMCKGANMLNQEGERLGKGRRLVSDFDENTECDNGTLFESQNLNDSFSMTPVDSAAADPLILPPALLLSNYCCEHDKAYTMRDLKPNQYRNYRHNESMRSLKKHLDSLIPPNISIRDFYNMKNLP